MDTLQNSFSFRSCLRTNLFYFVSLILSNISEIEEWQLLRRTLVKDPTITAVGTCTLVKDPTITAVGTYVRVFTVYVRDINKKLELVSIVCTIIASLLYFFDYGERKYMVARSLYIIKNICAA